MQDERKRYPWPDERTRDVGLAAGFILRDSSIDRLDMHVTTVEHYVVSHCSPAHSACKQLWRLLVTPQEGWGTALTELSERLTGPPA